MKNFTKWFLAFQLALAVPALADSFSDEEIADGAVEAQLVTEDIDQYKLDADFAKRTAEESSAEISKNKRQLKSLDSKKNALEDKIQKNSRIAAENQAKNAELQAQADSLKSEVQGKENRSAQVKDQLVQLKDQKAQIQAQILESRTSLKAEAKETASLRNEVATLKSKNKIDSRRNTVLGKQMSQLSKSNHKISIQAQQEKRKSDKVGAELARLTRLHGSLVAKNEALKNQLKSIRVAANNKRMKRVSLLKSNSSLRSQVRLHGKQIRSAKKIASR